MQTSYIPYRSIITFWKKWFPMVQLSHPSAGSSAKKETANRKTAKTYSVVQSPDSVRLRGPRAADPQRKNPAP